MVSGCGALISAVVFLATSFAIGGCGVFGGDEGSGGSESQGENEEVLRDYLAGDISTLDTAQATDGYSFNVINNFVEGLYRLDKDQEPQPAVAESHEMITYTFTLRDAEQLLLEEDAAIAPAYYAEAATLVKPGVEYATHPLAPGVDYRLVEIDR